MKRTLISWLLCAVVLVAITTTAGARPIKVLHVSEWMHDEVQLIINSVSATDLFEVTQMYYWEYHSDVPENLDEYDVVVFGLSDCYDFHRPLDELLSFLDNGGGVVFTHDTMSLVMPQDLRELAGIGLWTADWVWDETAEIIQDHVVLHFPYDIGNVGDFLDVQSTHNVVELLPTAQKIIKFPGEDAANNFYLTVGEYGAGRIILNQVGHGLGFPCHDPEPGETVPVEIPKVEESALFVNCLYWAGTDPIELCVDLIAQVEELGLPTGIETSLNATLEAAAKALDNHNVMAAINTLNAFIKQVESHRSKQIPEKDAGDLIAAAQEIILVLDSM